MTPLEHTARDTALAEIVRTTDVPIMPQVVDRLLTPSADACGQVHQSYSDFVMLAALLATRSGW